MDDISRRISESAGGTASPSKGEPYPKAVKATPESRPPAAPFPA
jgi:hypothetical protein